MRRRLLITGANGFIGRHVVRKLRDGGLNRDWEILLISTQESISEGPNGVQRVKCDLFNTSATSALLQNWSPSHLLHLAWVTQPDGYWHSPDNLRWLAASLWLVTEFGRTGGRHAVICGTSAEYQWGSSDYVEGETAERPATLYGCAKNALYRLMPKVEQATGLKWAWARIFQVYGPGEPDAKLVTSAIRQGLTGKPILCKRPSDERDFIHVTDVAERLLDLVGEEATGAYNICSGKGSSVKEVLDTVLRLIGKGEVEAPDQESLDERGSDRVVGSVEKGRLRFGWAARTPLDEGINEMVEAERRHLEALGRPKP